MLCHLKSCSCLRGSQAFRQIMFQSAIGQFNPPRVGGHYESTCPCLWTQPSFRIQKLEGQTRFPSRVGRKWRFVGVMLQ